MGTLGTMPAEAGHGVREQGPEELKARLDGGERLVLIDIRDPDEYRRRHIEPAVNLTKKLLASEIATAVSDPDTPIVLYCPAGPGSVRAGAVLTELGFTDVTSLAGGFDGWVASGFPTVGDSPFTAEQARRYSRHFMLPEIGEAGQLKLLRSKVLLIGAGGLGSPVGLYLAAAGVGTIGIIDGDTLDITNLQRQILHRTSDVGRPKVESAGDTITALNPDVTVVPHQMWITAENALDIIKDYDLVVDGSDNFATRYLVNDACYLAGKPQIHGAIFTYQGMATVFTPESGICYRCLYPEPPEPGLVPS